MHKTSAWPLALVYAALIVFASLFPFMGWRAQGIPPWVFLLAPLPPPYWTGFDVAINVVGGVISRRSHRWFRWFNEVPVLLLLAAVVLVVVKPF